MGTPPIKILNFLNFCFMLFPRQPCQLLRVPQSPDTRQTAIQCCRHGKAGNSICCFRCFLTCHVFALLIRYRARCYMWSFFVFLFFGPVGCTWMIRSEGNLRHIPSLPIECNTSHAMAAPLGSLALEAFAERITFCNHEQQLISLRWQIRRNSFVKKHHESSKVFFHNSEPNYIRQHAMLAPEKNASLQGTWASAIIVYFKIFKELVQSNHAQTKRTALHEV